MIKHTLFLLAASVSPLIAQYKATASKPVAVTTLSRLPYDLDCLKLNDPGELRGYNYYRNVAFDPQIAVNPTNPKNIVIVAQQDALANAVYNSSFPLATVVLFTVNGGKTWSQSQLVLSRCQGRTNIGANNNFISAYFPTVSFDQEGVCYILTSSYNLLAANAQTTVSVEEGNIIARSIDGGLSWNQITAAERDAGICHYLDFPFLTADRYRKGALYVVSSDDTCLVSNTCVNNPAFTGNQNIVFQKTSDGGKNWSPLSIIDSFEVDNLDFCTPIPQWHQLQVLPDKKQTLLLSSMIQRSSADTLHATTFDEIVVYRSQNQGESWKKFPVVKIPHILVTDPTSSDPILPVTDFTTKDMAINNKNGYVYLVYSDPQFNPTGQAGAVIRKSKDGGKTWSEPRPINPKSLNAQTFLPTVAVAKDGTVGVLFYDFRKNTLNTEELTTDVWMSFFDEELHQYYGEVRLTPMSFDSRKSIRGYNGVDPNNCQFDFYLSNHVGLTTHENDFLATFTVTNNACDVGMLATYPCDAFPLSKDECNRQNVVFVRIKKD
ncbi:MAG: exo-alpha-sialidase [Verrucomicrobia bacterium]|nr:exo-alpha-sialidase [Verrucomicrobiota bacterium]